ncbi:LOW QUALITY PROTEIN: receptor-type tyrosine-protein kinase FLT3 [Lethenteron reissneri]|uniref:LOW QUALITY PROTEIN: receptor-type tyrosine-protein kinase FLT3 n=1 Tax=Lethenteron reissneri TaxID=7753 RepID=UPI002AB7810F|nr:LOW QUALITY PROTEIN: receptor-type tyrosine-protein kinase FLT3 [Lethenteron reissneri]
MTAVPGYSFVLLVYAALCSAKFMHREITTVYGNERQSATIPCISLDQGMKQCHLVRVVSDTEPNASLNFPYSMHVAEGARIDNLSMDMQGRYRCVGLLGRKKVESQIFELIVEKDDHFHSVKLNASWVMLKRGDMFSVLCEVNSVRPNGQLKWIASSTNVSYGMKRFDSVDNGYYRTECLSVTSVHLDDAGNYTCCSAIRTQGTNGKYKNATVELVVVDDGFINVTKQSSDTHKILEEGDSTTLEVEMVAYPPISHWAWYHGEELVNVTEHTERSSVDDRHRYKFELNLLRVKANENGEYFFFAQNADRNISVPFSISVTSQMIGQLTVHVTDTSSIAAVIAVTCVLLVGFIVLLYKYKTRPRYEIRWKMIEAVNNGNSYIYIDPTQLPYDDKWEFPRNKLVFGKLLGSGAFGKVVKAAAHGLLNEDTSTNVAVKMLKPGAHSSEKEALMSELKIMSHLGHHLNIVNLLGACTVEGPTLVITEYCCFGDLLNFLQKKKSDFSLEIVKNKLFDYSNMQSIKNFLNLGETKAESNDYCQMNASMTQVDFPERAGAMMDYVECKSLHDGKNAQLAEMEEADNLPLDLQDLLSFALHVAKGMAFLSSKNCIHRDLAARNVLITSGRVAKICDFGLARDIDNDSNYVIRGNARLPVKWMSPESIFHCLYTGQSDVWSYGILLWEIFSLGETPYSGIRVDSSFYQMIQEGYRLPPPRFNTTDMYELMLACWNAEPVERPTFDQLVDLIERQWSYSHSSEEETLQ